MENRDLKCRHFGICGSCLYRDMPYSEQLELKEKEVYDLISEYLDDDCEWQGIAGSPEICGYRNKMEFSFGDAKKDGELELGLHKKGSRYDVITVDDCKIIDDDYRKILTETLAYFRGKECSYYHKKSHTGYLRHLLVRKGKKTGEILIDLVTSSQKPKDTICCENGLLEDYVTLLLDLKLDGKIAGILNTVNDLLSDTVKNEKTDILYGQDYFYEELCGLKFKITPFSFFQTNSLAAEIIYDKAGEFITACNNSGCAADESTFDKKSNVKGGSQCPNYGTVYDLYSGTGTIAQLVSSYARKVVGVEIVEEAVTSARENAELNDLHNCEFVAGDVLKVLDTIAEKPGYIILDPPRDGVNPKALRKIMDYGVDNILYISCKPASLQRDLQMLSWYYKPVKVCVIDQFPFTRHVETVVLLSKLKSTHHIEVEVSLDELDLTKAESKATYEEIRGYVKEHFGFRVTNLYIAQVKREFGIIERINYNVGEGKNRVPQVTPEKRDAIIDALKFFQMI